jgi:hypothetical protein
MLGAHQGSRRRPELNPPTPGGGNHSGSTAGQASSPDTGGPSGLFVDSQNSLKDLRTLSQKGPQ